MIILLFILKYQLKNIPTLIIKPLSFNCLGGIAGPALQSIMAGHIQRNEQGELQGALTSLMSLTTIIGPLMMNNLFKYFTTAKAPVYFPGVSFLLAAFFMLLSVLIAGKVLSRERKIVPPKII